MAFDDKEIVELKKETKDLLDKFSKALQQVKSDEESEVLRENFDRPESEGKVCEKEFREIIFKNTKNKSGDFFIAEKKHW